MEDDAGEEGGEEGGLGVTPDPLKAKERQRRYYVRHREKVLERKRRYKERPDVKAKTRETYRRWRLQNKTKIRERVQAYRALNPEKVRDYRLRCAYGLTTELLTKMKQEQGGKCAICDKPKRLLVDHDHKTGMVRGLLCHSCNVGIGLLGDSLESVKRAAVYLLAHQMKQEEEVEDASSEG